jgi:hypothetical protein
MLADGRIVAVKKSRVIDEGKRLEESSMKLSFFHKLTRGMWLN